MRTTSILLVAAFILAACAARPGPAPATTGDKAAPAPAPTPAERLAEDSKRSTARGNTFLAPKDWSLSTRGTATVLEAPEGGSWVALVDVEAESADAAVDKAWAEFGTERMRTLKVAHDSPDRDGWTDLRRYEYITSPNEKRSVLARTSRAHGVWTVAIYDMADAIGEKRGAQVGLIFDRLLPKGYERESFAGRVAHPLDAARVAELGAFIEAAQRVTGVPGVSVGLIQGDEIVFTGGFGVQQMGKPAPVDGDTKYLVASNTKALTTLMLGKLVDEKKLTWKTPATDLLPSFRLGDPDTTARVLVEHLICACTGLPRQDFEWIFEFGPFTPKGVIEVLGTMQPTSDFGALFQYSNPLAAAAGFVGGHVAYPELELGAAYDRAMQTRVFDPLGMADTTFDFDEGMRGNYAVPHAPNADGVQMAATAEVNRAIIPVRPAGGAWSTVKDVLAYVRMELARGTLPSGEIYISESSLLERRRPQVPIGADTTYGMGLIVQQKYDVPVVHHGGDLIGFHSDMMWLPDHGVGAVVLTNGDPGWLIRTLFRRKLLEVLFDGKPEADAEMAAAAKRYFGDIAAERERLSVPADPGAAGKLAARYRNPALGDIEVLRDGDRTIFDFGEWKSEMASRPNPDGTISMLTLAPGVRGFELVVGGPGPRTLTTRDGQHEYVFDEKK